MVPGSIGNARPAILEFAERAKVRGHFIPRCETPPIVRRQPVKRFIDVDPRALREQLSRLAIKGWLV